MAGQDGIKGGYWLAQQAGTFPTHQIPTPYFTHLFYGFVGVDQTGAITISQAELQLIQSFVVAVKKGNRKAMLSIGGPRLIMGDQSTAIAAMASDPGQRTTFINSTIEVSKNFHFDGVDLAWEFPRTQLEMDNLGLLIAEWRETITRRKSELILAATVNFSPRILRGHHTITYPADVMNANLNFINLILYDYSPVTSGPARLHLDQDSNGSSAHGIASWTNAGFEAAKLVMGIPLYGNKWTLADAGDSGIGAPVREYNGHIPYSQISGANNGTFDPTTTSQYLSVGNLWIGYEGAQSIAGKIHYAKGNNIGGYFLYQLADEDSDHTLSHAAFDAWNQN